jgi:hypothetical protein
MLYSISLRSRFYLIISGCERYILPTRDKIKVAFAHHNISHNTQGIMAGITDYMRNKGDWQLIVWPDSSLESL